MKNGRDMKDLNATADNKPCKRTDQINVFHAFTNVGSLRKNYNSTAETRLDNFQWAIFFDVEPVRTRESYVISLPVLRHAAVLHDSVREFKSNIARNRGKRTRENSKENQHRNGT